MLRAFLLLLSIVTDYETLADIARYSFMVAVGLLAIRQSLQGVVRRGSSGHDVSWLLKGRGLA